MPFDGSLPETLTSGCARRKPGGFAFGREFDSHRLHHKFGSGHKCPEPFYLRRVFCGNVQPSLIVLIAAFYTDYAMLNVCFASMHENNKKRVLKPVANTLKSAENPKRGYVVNPVIPSNE